MSKTAVITQPTYLPWLGYFETLARADVLVLLDSVQYVRRYWHSRNRLRDKQGRQFWLTVPVRAHAQKTPIREISIAEHQPEWWVKHLKSIERHLGRAPYFRHVYPAVDRWLRQPHPYLVELNISGIEMIMDLLNVRPQVLRASDLSVKGRRTRLLVDICRTVGADHYYTASGAFSYMQGEEYLFAEANVSVEYQTWCHPEYRQNGAGFVSHLSVIDALANIGPEATRRLIVSSGI